MRKNFKFLIGAMFTLMCLALVTIVIGLNTKTYADGTLPTTTPTDTTEVTGEDVEAETPADEITSEIEDILGEELTDEENAQIKELLDKALEGLMVVSTGDYNTIKAWAIGIVGVEGGIILLAFIIIIRIYLKRAREQAAHDKELAEVEKKFDDKLAKLEKTVGSKLLQDDADKKAEATKISENVVAILDKAMESVNQTSN